MTGSFISQLHRKCALIGNRVSRNISQIFDLRTVVVGGGVIEAGELLLEPARKAMMREMPFVGKHPVPEIVAAKLGNDAGLVGAADLSRN